MDLPPFTKKIYKHLEETSSRIEVETKPNLFFDNVSFPDFSKDGNRCQMNKEPTTIQAQSCDSVDLHAGDEASLKKCVTMIKDKNNSEFETKTCNIGSYSGVSVLNSGGYVLRLRGGGYNGLGNGSGGGGGLSSRAGADFSNMGDDAGISSRGVDLYNRSNSSSVDDTRYGGYEWVRRNSTDTRSLDTDENIGFNNRDSKSSLETQICEENKDGTAYTSKNNLYEGDTDESHASRPEGNGCNWNNAYSSNHFYQDCGRRARYNGSLSIGGDGGLTQRGGGRTFGGRGDDHYSQRDGGFGGGGDGGLSIRDNSGFAVRGAAGLGVREYDAFGSKRDGGFDNRDSGCFGAGGDNGLGIRDDGGFGGRGDGGFYNRDDGAFNKSYNDSFNNRSRFSNKGSRKTDRHSDNRGSIEGNSGGQEFNRGFNAARNSSLNGQYNEYIQENRARSD